MKMGSKPWFALGCITTLLLLSACGKDDSVTGGLSTEDMNHTGDVATSTEEAIPENPYPEDLGTYSIKKSETLLEALKLGGTSAQDIKKVSETLPLHDSGSIYTSYVSDEDKTTLTAYDIMGCNTMYTFHYASPFSYYGKGHKMMYAMQSRAEMMQLIGNHLTSINAMFNPDEMYSQEFDESRKYLSDILISIAYADSYDISLYDSEEEFQKKLGTTTPRNGEDLKKYMEGITLDGYKEASRSLIGVSLPNENGIVDEASRTQCYVYVLDEVSLQEYTQKENDAMLTVAYVTPDAYDEHNNGGALIHVNVISKDTYDSYIEEANQATSSEEGASNTEE